MMTKRKLDAGSPGLQAGDASDSERKRPDFVKVKLSKKGEQLAGGALFGISTGGRNFIFNPGEAQEVTRALDWNELLSKELRDGEALFELAEPDEINAGSLGLKPRVPSESEG